MAKSPGERIAELSEQVAVLSRLDEERSGVIARLQDRIAESEDRSAAEVARLDARLRAAEVETAALKQQLADHLAQYQEWDRRRWGLYVVLVGAVFTLASGLVATPARK